MAKSFRMNSLSLPYIFLYTINAKIQAEDYVAS